MTDEKRDKYLRKTYGISLADYKALLASQDGRCAICHKTPPPGGKALHTDHDHGWKKVKIYAEKPDPEVLWSASATYNGKQFEIQHWSKNAAKKIIKLALKKASVRGLLCWADNTALQKFRDNPERMESAAKYLRKHQGTLAVAAILFFAVLLRATPVIHNIEMVVGPTTKNLVQFTPMFPTSLKVVQVAGPSVDEHDHLDCTASAQTIGEPNAIGQATAIYFDCGKNRKFLVSELVFTQTQ